jgi:urate oxidase
MCSNNTILNMMYIVLNKPKVKLKKFCKYLSVFEENIDLTPKSITHKINRSICNLLTEVRSTILDKFAEILQSKYVLLDWMSLNAIDLLKERIEYENNLTKKNLKYLYKIDWKLVSSNSNAIDILNPFQI